MSARILVVDDIEANRRVLKAKLEVQYYTVLQAANGPRGSCPTKWCSSSLACRSWAG